MAKCKNNIECEQCTSRSMCFSYANFKYQQGYHTAIDNFLESLKNEYRPCKKSDENAYKQVCERFDEIARKLKTHYKTIL